MLPDVRFDRLGLMFLELLRDPFNITFSKCLGLFDGSTLWDCCPKRSIRCQAQDVTMGTRITDEVNWNSV